MGGNIGQAGAIVLNQRIDLDELVRLVDLSDEFFQWSLEITTGEVYPGSDDSAKWVPLPKLTEPQILDWMSLFADQATEPRIRSLLRLALQDPAPKFRFRDVLSVNPEVLKDWDTYFELKRRSILTHWLAFLGIEPGEHLTETFPEKHQAIADPKNEV